MHPRNTDHKTASAVEGGGGDGGRGEGGKGGGGEAEKGRGKIIYTNMTCTCFVVQVATSPCTTVKPEVDYQGAALQHRLQKVKKLKTQKKSCMCMLNDSLVSFCNITNCVGNATNMRYVFLVRHTLNNTIHTRMTQDCAGQSLQIEPGVYVTE